MKRFFIKVMGIFLACLMIISCLAGCSSTGKPLLGYEGSEISANVYMLFLSRLKGSLSTAANYGAEALTNPFWDTIMSNDGTTREEYYKNELLEDVKFYAAALYLFDELGLTLPKATTDEIDAELSDLMEWDADGSKTKFNSILSAYGANYEVLREAYLIEAKMAYLNEYLYGTNGSKIGDEVIEKYYEDNFVRFKHVFFYTQDIIYKQDADGNDIYYVVDGEGKIAYDTTALKRRNEAGDEVKDEKGDTVYENADGSIAYDKENGQRQPLYDANGYVQVRPFTKEELIAVNDHATLLMEELDGHEGNYTLFDSFVEKYSEDEGSLKYTNGFYMTADADYDAPKVLEAVVEMDAGEIRKIHSDYGIHIVMKYELDEGGYADKDNSDFFVGSTNGTYIFMSKLMTLLLSERIKPFVDKVWVDTELFESISVKAVSANYYY